MLRQVDTRLYKRNSIRNEQILVAVMYSILYYTVITHTHKKRITI